MVRTSCSLWTALAAAVLPTVSCTNLDFPPKKDGSGSDTGSPVRVSVRLRVSNNVEVPEVIIEPLKDGNGIADTLATGDDIQGVPVGSKANAGAPVVLPGPNGELDTEPVGDDRLSEVAVDVRVDFLIDGMPFVARVPAFSNLLFDLGDLPDQLMQRFPGLPGCPSEITIVAETWYPSGTYEFIGDDPTSREVDQAAAEETEALSKPIGGRSYLGTNDYNWLAGELSCGDTVWYDLRYGKLLTFKVVGG